MSMKPEDFAGSQPLLRLEDYFDGPVEAWGLVQDRFGKVRRQFRVTIVGERTAEGCRLHETFRYVDGAVESRVWSVRNLGDGRYEGTADDVVGKAVGRAAGSALNWRYRLKLTIGGRRLLVAFDDWMLLQDDGVLINRARLSKWGLFLGEVMLFFRKPPAEAGSRVEASGGGGVGAALSQAAE